MDKSVLKYVDKLNSLKQEVIQQGISTGNLSEEDAEIAMAMAIIQGSAKMILEIARETVSIKDKGAFLTVIAYQLLEACVTLEDYLYEQAHS